MTPPIQPWHREAAQKIIDYRAEHFAVSALDFASIIASHAPALHPSQEAAVRRAAETFMASEHVGAKGKPVTDALTAIITAELAAVQPVRAEAGETESKVAVEIFYAMNLAGRPAGVSIDVWTSVMCPIIATTLAPERQAAADREARQEARIVELEGALQEIAEHEGKTLLNPEEYGDINQNLGRIWQRGCNTGYNQLAGIARAALVKKEPT